MTQRSSRKLFGTRCSDNSLPVALTSSIHGPSVWKWGSHSRDPFSCRPLIVHLSHLALLQHPISFRLCEFRLENLPQGCLHADQLPSLVAALQSYLKATCELNPRPNNCYLQWALSIIRAKYFLSEPWDPFTLRTYFHL